MRLITILFLVVLSTLQVGGQTADTKTVSPLALDACKILANPSPYNGKMVKVHGSFRRTPEWAAIENRGCSDEILVVEPSDSSVDPPAGFQIQEDAAYRNFKKFSEERFKREASDNYEAGLPFKYEVAATFVGRVDSADVRLPSGKIESRPGFGPKERFRVRLVLKSVSSVVATAR